VGGSGKNEDSEWSSMEIDREAWKRVAEQAKTHNEL